MNGRLIAIGDIHGEVTKLHALIKLINPTPDDRLIFLGDYIDRGEDSARTIDYIIELKQWLPRTITLRGNHEEMMLATGVAEATDEDWKVWLNNGGDKTTKDYLARYPKYFPEPHKDFLHFLKLFHVEQVGDRKYVFVHAGLSPFIPIEPQLGYPDPSVMLWGRQHHKFRLDLWEDDYTVVCGHTPQRVQPKITKKLICIDTGAALKKPGFGTLTAIELPSNYPFRIYSENVRDGTIDNTTEGARSATQTQ